jgi:cell division protein FtsQ
VGLPGKVDLTNPIVLSGKEKDASLILQQAYRWKKQLEIKGLSVQAVSLSDSHAWRLTVSYPLNDYDFEVLLGREEVEQRLARFLFLFDEQFKQSDKQLKRVDARYPNGLAIRSEPLPMAEAVVMKESEKEPL